MPASKRPSTKMTAVLVSGNIIALVVTVTAAAADIELTELELIVAVFIVTNLMAALGWRIPEQRPATSAMDTLLSRGWKQPIPRR